MISSRWLVLSAIPAALALSLSAHADDYQAEIRLFGERESLSGPANPDIDTFSATGTYYIAPVKTDGLPLAEAAFLNRSSYVSANATRIDLGRPHVDVFSANFGYYVPNTIFFGRLGVAHSDFSGPGGDDTKFNGSFGVTPFAGLQITTDFDEDGWDPNVTAKYVGKLANAHYYSVSTFAVDPDEGDTQVGVDGAYFLDNTFSVGGGYTNGVDRWTVHAEKFFTSSFAVGAHLFTEDDGDGFGATVAWRF